MAERVASKTQKRTQKAPAEAEKAKAARVAPRAGGLEAECERLRGELAAAQARIRMLEQQRDDAANRIEWAIDSLHSLIDE